VRLRQIHHCQYEIFHHYKSDKNIFCAPQFVLLNVYKSVLHNVSNIYCTSQGKRRCTMNKNPLQFSLLYCYTGNVPLTKSWDTMHSFGVCRAWFCQNVCPRASSLVLTTLLLMLAPVFFTKLNNDVLFPSCCLVEETFIWLGAGLVVLETGLLVVGEMNASDWLKLRVLERTDSNCFTDFTKSLSLRTKSRNNSDISGCP